MRRRGESPSLMHSLSEFSFLLAFIFIAAAGLLAVFLGRLADEKEQLQHQYLESVFTIELLGAENTALRDQNAALEGVVRSLQEEVNGLQMELDRIRYANLPCWKRPDGTIPAIAGRVTIVSRVRFELWHYEKGSRSLELQSGQREEDLLSSALTELFGDSLVYARNNSCYLRVAIENQTYSFAVYSVVEDVLTALGLVIAR